MSARAFSPAREKEEAVKNEGREEGELIELYPQRGLLVIHSDKSSDKDKESSAERILTSQHELFEDILEEMMTVRIDMEAEELQWVKEELARDEQRNEKLAESLRIALQTLQRLELLIRGVLEMRLNWASQAEGVGFFSLGKPGRVGVPVRVKSWPLIG